MALFNSQSDARTERPTSRRRRQARERGLVARSGELLTAARLLAAWVVLAWWFKSFAQFAKAMLLGAFESSPDNPPLPQPSIDRILALARPIAANVGWPLWTATAAILVAHFGQVGWWWRTENMAPDFARLSPVSGLQRLLSLATIGRAMALLLKSALLLAACSYVIWPFLESLSPNASWNIADQLASFGATAVRLALSIALSLLAYALLDYGWQRWRFERSLQMTREELREELKDSQGSPLTRRHHATIPHATPPNAIDSNPTDADSQRLLRSPS